MLWLTLFAAFAGFLHAPTIDYVVKEVGGVVLEYPAGSAAVAQGAYRIYNESLPLVESALGIPAASGGVRITIAPNRVEFERIVSRASGGTAPPDRALAVALPGRRQMVIKASSLEAFTDNSLLLTVRHEMVHLALGDSRRRIPKWFEEGVAEQVAGKAVRWRQRRMLRAKVRAGTLTPFRELVDRFPTHEDWSIAYPQSLSFVQYIIGRFGDDALRGIVRRLREGIGFEKALSEETGSTLSRLERDWKEKLRGEGSLFEGLFTAEARSAERAVLMGIACLVVAMFVVVMIRRRRALRRMDAGD
ncbi:MAG: hypothetical protein O6952_03600 [Planctomycetota bacterium]|nr:hypothetical protein [Planctomycetota bacterium]